MRYPGRLLLVFTAGLFVSILARPHPVLAVPTVDFLTITEDGSEKIASATYDGVPLTIGAGGTSTSAFPISLDDPLLGTYQNGVRIGPSGTACPAAGLKEWDCITLANSAATGNPTFINTFRSDPLDPPDPADTETFGIGSQTGPSGITTPIIQVTIVSPAEPAACVVPPKGKFSPVAPLVVDCPEPASVLIFGSAVAVVIPLRGRRKSAVGGYVADR